VQLRDDLSPRRKTAVRMSAITMRPGWLAQAAFVFCSRHPSCRHSQFLETAPPPSRVSHDQTPLNGAVSLTKRQSPPTCYFSDTLLRSPQPVRHLSFLLRGTWGVISGIACPSRGHELWGRACFCRENGMKVPTHRLANRPPERSWEGFGKRAEARSRAVRAIQGVTSKTSLIKKSSAMPAFRALNC